MKHGAAYIGSRTRRWLLIATLIASVVFTAVFAGRAYRSFVFLQSAFEAGAPMTASVRPWMTIDYVASNFGIPGHTLIARLTLPPTIDKTLTLKSVAEQTKQSPSELTLRVQVAVADLTRGARPQPSSDGSWLRAIVEQFLGALLQYGYPILALTLLFGSFGFPLPDGIVAAVAGSLVAQGQMHWFGASAISVSASIMGDAAAYGLGYWLNRGVLERHGKWMGYTRAHHLRVERLFYRWGALTLFLTRTVVSHLSSVTSLLAGMGQYRLWKFLLVAFLGRIVWTAAYLGVGYKIGADWEATMGLFSNVSGLFAAVVVLVASARMLYRTSGHDRQV